MRAIFSLGLAAALLGGCATTPHMPPTEVIRYHLGEPIARGTVAVVPDSGPNAPASIEFKTYAAAVEGALLRNGYTLPATGTQPQFVATVSFRRTNRVGPPRPSPFSIGLGGASFGGGRGGGVGLGGGVSFPVGKGRSQEIIVTELGVQIKNRIDQSPVWEGQAHTAADIRSIDADAGAQAQKLATALFTGFPGESGRTIEVK
jgi:hypothetical protein